MEIYLGTDHHAGHDKIIEYENRPVGFEKLILNNWNTVVKRTDLAIFLGDLFLGPKEVYDKYIRSLNGMKVVTLGNHDSHPFSWYMERGFNFACERFDLKRYGYHIAFSHRPLDSSDFDFNIHGHHHRSLHRIVDTSPKHILLSIEDEDYQPVTLKDVLRRKVNI